MNVHNPLIYFDLGGLVKSATDRTKSMKHAFRNRYFELQKFILLKSAKSLSSNQCYNVPRMTVLEFANQICERAKKFDLNIQGEGVQEASENPENSCRVYCKSKNGKPVTKSWTFPDGTICRNENSDLDENYFCVNGRCEVSFSFRVLFFESV